MFYAFPSVFLSTKFPLPSCSFRVFEFKIYFLLLPPLLLNHLSRTMSYQLPTYLHTYVPIDLSISKIRCKALVSNIWFDGSRLQVGRYKSIRACYQNISYDEYIIYKEVAVVAWHSK